LLPEAPLCKLPGPFWLGRMNFPQQDWSLGVTVFRRLFFPLSLPLSLPIDSHQNLSSQDPHHRATPDTSEHSTPFQHAPTKSSFAAWWPCPSLLRSSRSPGLRSSSTLLLVLGMFPSSGASPLKVSQLTARPSAFRFIPSGMGCSPRPPLLGDLAFRGIF